MTEYSRKEPYFSLCGLNCCLCPRFHTDGSSKCPGCGGPDFVKKHPTCSVVTCNKKHDSVEYCFECSEYPCQKYKEPSKVDSFISYKEVLNNFDAAQKDLSNYLKDLNKRYVYLSDLIKNYNDGKMKELYCIALNNLPLDEIEQIMKQIKANNEILKMDRKERARSVGGIIKERAQALKIEISLRK